MNSLHFEEGLKTYCINDDPDRVIKVSTTDYGIINRLQEADKNMKKKADEYKALNINTDGSAADKTEEAAAAIKELTEFIEGQINYVFNADVAKIVFNGQSCLSTYKGVPLYERFMNAIVPEIEKDFKEEVKESQKRVSKYTGSNKYKKATGKR